jgi:hypothetical protein
MMPPAGLPCGGLGWGWGFVGAVMAFRSCHAGGGGRVF